MKLFRSAAQGATCLCISLLCAAPANAQMDMAVMNKWMTATVIHWSVMGEYEGENLILNAGTNGYAPVKDRVEIGFDYTTAGNGGLVGTPTFKNAPTQMGALRNGAKGCRAPTVSGTYEHATIVSLKNGLGGQLAMMVRTDYPAGAVPVACTGGNQASAARTSTAQEELVVPGIMLLAMGSQMTGKDVQVSKDKKSLIVKRGGWTYTYTPTKVK